jgi:hypothetical protein
MSETYLVDVDIEQLRAHRSRLERRELTEADVRQWLVSFGFYPRVDGLYLAEQPVLQQLDPSEIIAAHPVAANSPAPAS